jgi:hypothetical protein
MDELEKAKLLSVATKLAKAEIEEARSQLLEQINSLQPKNGRDGRSIVDACIFEGQLTLQFSDGTITNLGQVVGTSGLTGATGAKGEKGDPGEAGPPGPRGDTGLTGPAGKDGERGPRGDKGDKGDPGLKGDKGDKGDRGEQGEQGIPGERGERGERGEQGPRGIDGTNGRDGNDGAKGPTGARGPQGIPGRDGKDGKDGEVGPQGPKGDKGDKGDPGSDADVSKLEKKLDQFEQDVDRRISKIAFNAATGGGSAGSGEVWLHKLEDVDYNIKNATNGQALVWNASLGKWQANTISGGGGLTVSKVLTNGSYANSVSNVTGLRFDDDSGFDVVDLGSGNVKVQMNSTFKYWNVNGVAALTAVGLDTANFIAGSGLSISANPANNSLTFSTNLNNTTLTGTTTIANLVLSNVLGVRYGGTGKSSLTQNGVMYAANSSAFAFATGTNGKVMQIGSTGVPVFDDIDGGSFT